MSSKHPRRRRNFLERTAAGLTGALGHAGNAGQHSDSAGVLQRLDPRVKLFGFLLLIVLAAGARNIFVTLGIFVVGVALAALARISLRTLASGVWPGVFVLTGLIALPAIFITPGAVIARLPLLDWPVTGQGVRSAVRLLTRGETTATLAAVLVLSTPWPHVLKALRVFRVPVLLVVILGMTHRYIFLLLALALDFFEGRRSRLLAPMDGRQSRRLAGSAVGVLLEKSLQTSGDVFLAMRSRGFRGEVYLLDDFRMAARDWCALAAFAGVAALAIVFEMS